VIAHADHKIHSLLAYAGSIKGTMKGVSKLVKVCSLSKLPSATSNEFTETRGDFNS